jgi:purine-binding chemotaxis protein CheW
MTSFAAPSATAHREAEFAAFCVGDILLGIPIDQVEEINRQLDPTPVPHVPDYVRGVINLRGDVVTVVDLRTVLGMGRTELGRQTRNIIVGFQGERIGLMVDRVADVVRVSNDQYEPQPANVGVADGRFFQGVYKLENDLMVVLRVEAVLEGQEL